MKEAFSWKPYMLMSALVFRLDKEYTASSARTGYFEINLKKGLFHYIF